jgi:hypothetical protein
MKLKKSPGTAEPEVDGSADSATNKPKNKTDRRSFSRRVVAPVLAAVGVGSLGLAAGSGMALRKKLRQGRVRPVDAVVSMKTISGAAWIGTYALSAAALIVARDNRRIARDKKRKSDNM